MIEPKGWPRKRVFEIEETVNGQTVRYEIVEYSDDLGVVQKTYKHPVRQ